jgi:hypothetical protein
MWAARFTAGSSWGPATLVETENAGDAARPDIAFDADGNGIAVWYQGDGTRDNIWTNRYSGGAWGGPQTIESSGNTFVSPEIVVHSSGFASAVWVSGSPFRDVWANHYD